MKTTQLMFGQYNHTGNDLLLTGSAKAIKHFANLLLSGDFKIELQTPQFAALPYDRFLGSISVKLQEGKVNVRRDNAELFIYGSSEYLIVFADNLKFLADQADVSGSENHIHIEHHPNHYYLDPLSTPIVISVVTDFQE